MSELITGELPTTLQGFFDNAWRWVHRPDFKKCVDREDADHCLYRSEDNTNACLIGCSIPDTLYDPSFEASFMHMLDSLGDAKHLENELYWLQQCHDRVASAESMKEELSRFSKAHNLTIPSLTAPALCRRENYTVVAGGVDWGGSDAEPPTLLQACKAVVDNWESGDLAAAARMCQQAYDEATNTNETAQIKEAPSTSSTTN